MTLHDYDTNQIAGNFFKVKNAGLKFQSLNSMNSSLLHITLFEFQNKINN